MPLKKNTSLSNEYTDLLTVFQAHFTGYLHLARVRLICLFILSLCKVKSVNYSKLSAGFDAKADRMSSYRRIQRFMGQVDLPMQLVTRLIFSLLPNKEKLVLVMDRTNWKFGGQNINILMLGVSYRNIAFPLMFRMLDKGGNSNTAERMRLIGDFMEWFGSDRIGCLLADREFIGETWLRFLNENKIRYYIRIRNNFKVLSPRTQRQVTAWHLFSNLKVGECRNYEKIVSMHKELCYLSGIKIVNDGKVEFVILVCFNLPREALTYYKQRWQVETLFKGLKGSGFNIEDTHVTNPDRLEKLVMLVMIAFVWCYKIGDYIDREIKPIKIKKHGNRAVSVFKYGLDYIAHSLLSGFNRFNINLIQFLSCT